MISGPRQLLRYIGTLASGSDPRPATDADLLSRFVRHRDEDAFATLVARHAPMVLAVCRRALRDRQDAEDATQAVFLVLARKAATLRRPNALAAWLHGVARHAALKSRRSNERRRVQEARRARVAVPPPPPDPRDELTARELLQAVDEELQRLPEVYRVPIVLCCLEGRSQDEAAAYLGWTPGSLRGRLERGRKRLHARLVRRGLALSVPLVALELSQALAARGMSASVAEGMKHAAVAFAAGEQAQASALSAEAAALGERILEGMAMARLKLGLALFLAAGLVAAGAGAVAHQMVPAKQPEAPQEWEPAPPNMHYLSDLAAFDIRVSEGRFATRGYLGYHAGNPSSDRILVNHELSPNGLSMHAESNTYAAAKYTLKKAARTFLASVALNDSAGGAGRAPGVGRIPTPLTFQVYGDGKVLWNSTPVDLARRVQACEVDVTGVDVLELRVDCPGSGVNAQAVWIEPRVLLK
jgi:RNA polymerase sigma factor (sigma-70 family)